MSNKPKASKSEPAKRAAAKPAAKPASAKQAPVKKTTAPAGKAAAPKKAAAPGRSQSAPPVDAQAVNLQPIIAAMHKRLPKTRHAEAEAFAQAFYKRM
ncbi:hypothetical protein AB4084_33330, partial [Lysobacter sp. 2RAB21]